jgi:hypothetical protein
MESPGTTPCGATRASARRVARCVALAAVVAGIATVAGSGRSPSASALERPPQVVIRGGGVELRLDASSYCWKNACVDGVPQGELPSLENARRAIVSFPEPDWRFEATVVPHGQRCGRQQTAALKRLSDTTYRLRPLGRAGDYDVSLFGRGAGDLYVSFRWQTPVDGPRPNPAATISIIANHDGQPASYGVSLDAQNLRATPKAVTGRVDVTSASGAQRAIDLTSTASDCEPEGTIRLGASEDEGRAAAALGPGPFTYEVALDIDGVTHHAVAHWPADEDPECSPCVPLHFDPSLPSLRHR